MRSESTNVLTYAVRSKVVLKFCSQMGLMLALLSLVPLAFAVVDQDTELAIRYLVLCSGLVMLWKVYARIPVPGRIQRNEVLTITSLTFILAAVIMSWPLMATNISFIDALFESVSGVTTTGLSTLNKIESQSPGFLFTRAWMQWYGGLGFIVFTVALIMGHQGSVRYLTGESDCNETFITTAHSYAKRSFYTYLLLTITGFFLVWPFTGDIYVALLHVLSAVSTGGFSIYDASLQGMKSQGAAIAILVVSFLGAISLPLYWNLVNSGIKNGLRLFFTDIELRYLLLFCLLTSGVLLWLGWLQDHNLSWYHSLMLGFSAQTTTGYATQSISQMDPASKIVMIMSMMTGGSVGSSAGGIKILRLLILFRFIQLIIRRTGMSQYAVAEPYLGDRKIESNEIERAMQIIILFIGVMVLSWLPFVVMGYDPLNALFEVASACGTVGLSSGITRMELEPFLKCILCFDMLAGRLEVLALLVILYPRNWFGHQKDI